MIVEGTTYAFLANANQTFTRLGIFERAGSELPSKLGLSGKGIGLQKSLAADKAIHPGASASEYARLAQPPTGVAPHG
jgi:hypothetical protein